MLKRVITAVVLFAIIAAAIATSIEAFEIVMAVALVLTLGEWLKMAQIKAPLRAGICALFAAGSVWIILNKIALNPIFVTGLLLLAGCIWLAITAICYNCRISGFQIPHTQSFLLALLLITAALVSVYSLIEMGGWKLMLSAFMIVWIADIFAYFTGKSIGKNKMCPAISPKKSWEGALGAYVFVYLAVLAAWFWLPHDYVLTSLLIERAGFVAGTLMIFILVSVSISGDLFESALKRQIDIKDSGSILPGHGGFYDRLDAALSVLPCSAACLLIL